MTADDVGGEDARGPEIRPAEGAESREEEDPTWPFVGVLLAVLWLFVNGVALEPAALVGQFLVGLLLGLPLAYASRRFYWPETDPWRLLRAVPYMVLYTATFLRVLLVANVDVAYRVLAPSMPIRPAVIDLPLRVETDVAITTIANSISLTPGTLTMDYDADRNALSVHAIDGRDPEAVARPIRRWEDYALVIFDEPLKPGDPVPGEVSLAADGGEGGSVGPSLTADEHDGSDGEPAGGDGEPTGPDGAPARSDDEATGGDRGGS